jgi:hypothetical protein
MSKRQMRDTAQPQQIHALLEAALALPPGEREAWLQTMPPAHRPLTPSLRPGVDAHDPPQPPRPHDRHAVSPRNRPDTHQLQQMNTLLQAALELPEAQREAWLQALPEEQRALAPLLRAMLQRAAVETDDFMRQPVGLRWRA